MTQFLNAITAPERQFFSCLQGANLDTAWGVAISEVIQRPDVMRFRRLTAELKSQAADNKEIMISILNHDCYNQLINL